MPEKRPNIWVPGNHHLSPPHRGMNLSAIDISPLAACIHMETLDIEETGTTKLHFLSEITSLRGLVCGVNPLTSLYGLAGNTRLECLDVSVCGLTSFQELTGMSGLRFLRAGNQQRYPRRHYYGAYVMANSPIHDVSDLGPLAAMTRLEHLDLHDCTGIKDLRPLATATSLVVLNIGGTGVTSLSPCRTLINLREIDITRLYYLHPDIPTDLVLAELPLLMTIHTEYGRYHIGLMKWTCCRV